MQSLLEEKLRALEYRLTGQLTQLAQLTLDRRRRPGLRVTRGSPELDGHTHSEPLDAVNTTKEISKESKGKAINDFTFILKYFYILQYVDLNRFKIC